MAFLFTFAKKWDPQPFHIDPVAALNTPMKGLTASSAHTYSIIGLLNSMKEPIASIASIKHEMELPEPSRSGDLLTLDCLNAFEIFTTTVAGL